MQLRDKRVIAGILLVLTIPTVTFASIRVYFSLVDNPEEAIIEELNKAKDRSI